MLAKNMREGGFFSVLGLAMTLAWAFGQPTTASAVDIVRVSGPNDSGSTITHGTATAVYFHLNQTFQNVSIAADYAKFNASGGVLLTNSIGPGSSFGNVLASANLNASTPVSPNPIFSGLTLPASDYFLVFSQDASATTGFVVWNGSTTATDIISTHPMASTVPSYFSASNAASLSSASNFSLISGTSLHFSVTGDVAPVPEPGSLFLILALAGVAGVGKVPAIRRRRKSVPAA